MYTDSIKIETKSAFVIQQKKPCTRSPQTQSVLLAPSPHIYVAWRSRFHFLGIAFLNNDT